MSPQERDNALPQLEILMIENNPAEARLTVEALNEIGRSEGVRSVADG